MNYRGLHCHYRKDERGCQWRRSRKKRKILDFFRLSFKIESTLKERRRDEMEKRVFVIVSMHQDKDIIGVSTNRWDLEIRLWEAQEKQLFEGIIKGFGHPSQWEWDSESAFELRFEGIVFLSKDPINCLEILKTNHEIIYERRDPTKKGSFNAVYNILTKIGKMVVSFPDA